MATVQYWDDPNEPGCRLYAIVAATADEVQQIILARMAWVDTALGGVPGLAHFTTPKRDYDGLYRAYGEVIIT